ncbi:UNVERIFIED_CONTAM: hypothetical protein HDU68_005160 [Siphonaria sp. JEL0065]|nr:hypothetical protein HDU68_005160 [Siphonaria sp. JEL0065]
MQIGLAILAAVSTVTAFSGDLTYYTPESTGGIGRCGTYIRDGDYAVAMGHCLIDAQDVDTGLLMLLLRSLRRLLDLALGESRFRGLLEPAVEAGAHVFRLHHAK